MKWRSVQHRRPPNAHEACRHRPQGNGFSYTARWSETAPPDRTVHDLRHYAASAWLRAGIPVRQVARWLGHANPAVTLNTYAHILGEAQDVAAIAQLNARSALGRSR